jgi:hypothetical protein
MAPGLAAAAGARLSPSVDGRAAGDERLMNDDLATCSDAPD